MKGPLACLTIYVDFFLSLPVNDSVFVHPDCTGVREAHP